MKITHATWEKRNFGMDTYEIYLDKEDLREFEAVLEKIRSQNFKNAYVLIKIPVGDLKALHALEDEGFRFLETQLYFVEHFKVPTLDSNTKGKITKEILKKDKNAWEKIISKITPGMFDSDRVSLDPALGQDISCRRYQNWCRDLFDDENTYMMVGKINGIEYCFGIYKKEQGRVNAILVGIFDEFKKLGLGSTLLDETNDERVTTTSSNNPAAFKVYQKCGLIMREDKYVLRKIY